MKRRVVILASILATVLALTSIATRAIELDKSPSGKIAKAAAQGQWLVAIAIERIEAEHTKAISPADILYNGESFRLSIISSQSGKVTLSVPSGANDDKNGLMLTANMQAGEPTFLPSLSQGVFVLDQQPGIEWLYLAFAINHQAPSKHPNGRLKQVILRHVELRAGAGQKLDFAPDSQTIYLSPGLSDDNQMVLQVGLNHLETKTSPLKQ